MRRFPTLCSALLVLFIAAPAWADVASWMLVGGGAGYVSRPGQPDVAADTANSTHTFTNGLLQLETGLGSNPRSSWVFGGLMRTLTYFGSGTDLMVVQRTATGSFARGDWGLALDLGGYQRWWGPESTGGVATLNLGGPWGLNLAVSGALGSNSTTSIGLTLGVDWARATVHRQSGLNWWPNTPLPIER